MDDLTLIDEISSQKDIDNKDIKKAINSMNKISADKVDIDGELYTDEQSVYFVPMHKSQYVLVCVSNEPINTDVLQNCENRNEIIDAGTSMSSSFRAIAGGRVKADDPLLEGVRAYENSEKRESLLNDMVNDVVKVICGESNELISLMKKEDYDYTEKIDMLKEIQYNLAISILASDRGNLDELKDMEEEYDKLIDETMDNKEEFIKNSVDVLRKITDARKAGLDKITKKYGKEDNNIKLAATDVMVRCPINKNMCLICSAKGNIDLDTLGEIKSSSEAREAGLTPKGAVIYGNKDEEKPTKKDVFIKMNSELEKFIDDSNECLVDYDNKYSKTNKELSDKLKELRTKKNALVNIVIENFKSNNVTDAGPGFEDVKADENTIDDMSRSEMIEMYARTSKLIEEVTENHKKISDDYLESINKINNLALDGKLPEKEIKINSKYAYQGNQILSEMSFLREEAVLHMTLDSYNINRYEVDNDDLIVDGDELVTTEEYNERHKEETNATIVDVDSKLVTSEEVVELTSKDVEEDKKEEPKELNIKVHYFDDYELPSEKEEVTKSDKAKEIDVLKSMSEQLSNHEEVENLDLDEDLEKLRK